MGWVTMQMPFGMIPLTLPDLEFCRGWYGELQPFWVYPSMFYSDG